MSQLDERKALEGDADGLECVLDRSAPGVLVSGREDEEGLWVGGDELLHEVAGDVGESLGRLEEAVSGLNTS